MGRQIPYLLGFAVAFLIFTTILYIPLPMTYVQTLALSALLTALGLLLKWWIQ
ncbi:MAG: hypothetical protein ACQESG_00145 [Nanobdellota archaeon]